MIDILSNPDRLEKTSSPLPETRPRMTTKRRPVSFIDQATLNADAFARIEKHYGTYPMVNGASKTLIRFHEYWQSREAAVIAYDMLDLHEQAVHSHGQKPSDLLRKNGPAEPPLCGSAPPDKDVRAEVLFLPMRLKTDPHYLTCLTMCVIQSVVDQYAGTPYPVEGVDIGDFDIARRRVEHFSQNEYDALWDEDPTEESVRRLKATQAVIDNARSFRKIVSRNCDVMQIFRDRKSFGN